MGSLSPVLACPLSTRILWTSCMRLRTMRREERPRTPPPSSARIRGICPNDFDWTGREAASSGRPVSLCWLAIRSSTFKVECKYCDDDGVKKYHNVEGVPSRREANKAGEATSADGVVAYVSPLTLFRPKVHCLYGKTLNRYGLDTDPIEGIMTS